ncbi:MAG: hypothetical protein J6R92_00430 [Akkermansia sp.]|nr:hypothetical protein [Akkermansia sp.]
MKLLTKKNAALVLQLLTVAGVLIGMGAGLLIVNEMTDVYMLDGVLYTMQPGEQFKAMHDAVHELIDDSIVYCIVAAFALTISFITGVASFILTCFLKTSPEQSVKKL